MPDLIYSLREALAERYDIVRQLGEGAHARYFWRAIFGTIDA